MGQRLFPAQLDTGGCAVRCHARIPNKRKSMAGKVKASSDAFGAVDDATHERVFSLMTARHALGVAYCGASECLPLLMLRLRTFIKVNTGGAEEVITQRVGRDDDASCAIATSRTPDGNATSFGRRTACELLLRNKAVLVMVHLGHTSDISVLRRHVNGFQGPPALGGGSGQRPDLA